MSKQPNRQAEDGNIIRIDIRNKWFKIAIIGLCFLFLLGVRLQVNQAITGDEPHYLLMDYSLIHDHDLSLTNNYRDGDGREFYSGVLTYQGVPQVSPRYAAKQYSTHGIGLPVFLLPGFYIGAKTGAVFELVLLATLVIWLTWIWTAQITGNKKTAYIAAALLAICYFFNGLTGAIYPDMLIAALTLLVLIAAERYYRRPAYQLLTGMVLGFLVLAHFKTLDVVIPVLLILSYKLWKSDRKLPWITILTTAVFVVYYYLTLHQWFGSWSLSHIEGGQSFGANPQTNLSAMLFDSSRGLLVYNPVLLLIFAGLPIWFKKHRESLAVTLAALVPSIVVLCLIPNWNGGAAPSGRYIIEFLPAFIPALAFAIERLYSFWQRAFVLLLGSVTFLITLDATMSRFPEVNGARPVLFSQIQQHTGLALDRLLPAYSSVTTLISGHGSSAKYSLTTVLNGKHGLVKLAAGYLVVIGMVAYGYYLSRTNGGRQETPSSPSNRRTSSAAGRRPARSKTRQAAAAPKY